MHVVSPDDVLDISFALKCFLPAVCTDGIFFFSRSLSE